METGQPQASILKNVFEGLIQFLPDWLEISLLCLILALVVFGWVQSIRGRIARRRAARAPQPVVPPQAQGTGADHLGAWAPATRQAEPQPAPGGPSGAGGADFLGAYAPQQRRDGD